MNNKKPIKIEEIEHVPSRGKRHKLNPPPGWIWSGNLETGLELASTEIGMIAEPGAKKGSFKIKVFIFPPGRKMRLVKEIQFKENGFQVDAFMVKEARRLERKIKKLEEEMPANIESLNMQSRSRTRSRARSIEFCKAVSQLLDKLKKSRDIYTTVQIELKLEEIINPADFGLESMQELLYEPSGADAREMLIGTCNLPDSAFNFNAATREKKFYHMRVRPPGKRWNFFIRSGQNYKITKSGEGRQFSTLDVGDMDKPGVQGLAFIVGFRGFKPGDQVPGTSFKVQQILVERTALDLPNKPTTKQIERAIKNRYGNDIIKKMRYDTGKKVTGFFIVEKGKDFAIKLTYG